MSKANSIMTPNARDVMDKFKQEVAPFLFRHNPPKSPKRCVTYEPQNMKGSINQRLGIKLNRST